ncbi:MAG: DoxX family protein [Algisphaera sp.]
MNTTLQAALALLGRICIALIFLLSAVGNKIPNFNGVAGAMASKGVPYPKVALVGAIVFLLVGAVSIIAGFRTRIGALLLLIFLGLATFYFHDFWNLTGDDRGTQQIQFMKNMAIGGGLLMLMAAGPGKYGFAVKRTKAD